MKNETIRYRTGEPDYSGISDVVFDWEISVYGIVSEIMPHNLPTPKGRSVTLTHYVDANLMHDLMTGRSVTGIIHLINQTPIYWYSRKQSTVETATYGSEFFSARTCVEQISDLRTTLRYLGVPINGKRYMYGDNEAVVNSSMKPYARLHKRHNNLSFHKVRESIASKMIMFHHIPGKINPSDIVIKQWSRNKTWNVLQPMLFWEGDTALISSQDNVKKYNCSIK